MITESLILAPAIIGVVLSGFLGLTALVWYLMRPAPIRAERERRAGR